MAQTPAPVELFPTAGQPELKGAVLVLPAVAFANIGELAVDAAIATLQLQRVAALDHASVLPCVGNNPYQLDPPGQMATALELYEPAGTGAGHYFLLQQRAPAVTGLQHHYAKALAAWITQSGFKQVVLVTGLDAQYRREAQLEGASQLRWLAQGEGSDSDLRSQLAVPELEAEALATEQEVHGLLPPWPLWEELQQAGVPSVLLAKFASEGDNTADGLLLAEKLLQLLQALGLLPPGEGAAAAAAAGAAGGASSGLQLKVPCSWSAALYGGMSSAAAAGELVG